MSFWTFVLGSAAGLYVPFLVTSLGEVISERSGVINIGLGGMMTAGAYFGFVVSAATGSALLGVFAAIAAGIATAGVMAAIAVWRNADQILTGFAIFIMVPAFCDYLYVQRSSHATFGGMSQIKLPGLSALPLLGGLFDQNLFFYASLVLIPVVLFLLDKTYSGLRLSASGHAPNIALAKGVSVMRTRIVATLVCGGLAGLGGATLTVGVLGSYSPGVVSAEGFIVLAIVILGRWKVGLTALAAALLAVADALQLRLAATSHFPPQLLASVPWLIVIVVLTVGVRRSSAVPGALMSPTPSL